MDCSNYFYCFSGSEVFSTSTDGQVLCWDIRKLVEPTESLPLEYAGYKPGLLLGGLVLEYESTMVRVHAHTPVQVWAHLAAN